MEDKILILRFKRGSTDALCRIYRKYEGVMLTVAAGLLGDVHAAQDAVHDGLNGIEIPNVATEPGGIVLIRTKVMLPSSDDADDQRESTEDMLIRVELDLLQTP